MRLVCEDASTTKRKPLTVRQKLKIVEDQKARGQNLTCASCEIIFYRHYPVAASRALKPQYCSTDCKWDAFKARADAGRADRFWSHVDRRGPNECWPWKRFCDAKGYGKFQWAKNDPRQAHRTAYFLTHGVWAPEYVCHSCDSPPCCNPAHLWAGSPQQNFDDMRLKGRANIVGPASEKAPWAKLSIEKAQEIFLSPERGNVLAARFGITRFAVSDIRVRKTWRAATQGLIAPKRNMSRIPGGVR